MKKKKTLENRNNGKPALARATGSVWDALDYAFENREGVTLTQDDVFFVWMKLARGTQLECLLRDIAKHPVEARAAGVCDGESAQDLARRCLPPNTPDEPTPAHSTSTKQENGHDKH